MFHVIIIVLSCFIMFYHVLSCFIYGLHQFTRDNHHGFWMFLVCHGTDSWIQPAEDGPEPRQWVLRSSVLKEMMRFSYGESQFSDSIYIYTYIHIYTVYINIYIYVYIYVHIYIYNNMYIIYAPFLNHRTHNSFRWVLTDTLAWTGPQSDRNRMRAGKAGHKMIVFFFHV